MSVRPALRRQIRDRLVAAPALEGVQISYGWAAEYEKQVIVIDGPEDDASSWAAIGAAKTRDSRFSIPLRIEVRMGGETAEESDIRADEILEAVYDVVRAAENFDNLLLMPPLLDEGEWINFPGTDGFVTHIEVHMRCTVRS